MPREATAIDSRISAQDDVFLIMDGSAGDETAGSDDGQAPSA
jgi:hypothetical protein